jgi:hypothetical protein
VIELLSIAIAVDPHPAGNRLIDLCEPIWWCEPKRHYLSAGRSFNLLTTIEHFWLNFPETLSIFTRLLKRCALRTSVHFSK